MPLVEDELTSEEKAVVENLLGAEATDEEREHLRAGILRDVREGHRIEDELTAVADAAIARVRATRPGPGAGILVGVTVFRWGMTYALKTLNLTPEALADAAKNVLREMARAKRERS